MLSCIWPMDWVPVLHIPFLFWILINVLFFWSENSNIIFNDTYNLWKLLLSWLQESRFIWLLLYFFFQVSPVMYSFCEGLVNWCLKALGNELLASLATLSIATTSLSTYTRNVGSAFSMFFLPPLIDCWANTIIYGYYWSRIHVGR